ILSLLHFLQPGLHDRGGWNAGFLREDALLAMIVVSDEDEAISAQNESYLKTNAVLKEQRIQEFTERLQELKPDRPDLVRFDAVVAPSKRDCSTVGSTNGIVGTGDVYMEVAEMLKRKSTDQRVTNICKNFAQDLAGIGSDIALQIERRFKLKYKP